jgi:RNA polymerase-binding protein DksA
MKTEFLEKIKEDLLKQKEQLEKELSEFRQTKNSNSSASFPQYGDEADENAQEVSQYTTDLETKKILESTLKDVDSALDQIKKGTYGVCKYCGKEIEEKRLEIRPFSSSCVRCKNALQNQK